MERRLHGDARVPPAGRRCDPTVYYAQHSYLFSLFGGLQPKIAEWTAQERSANPDAHLTLAWVPHDWVRGLYFYDDFDVRFSETFYDARGSTASTRPTFCAA